ncbi:MAG: extracellular solute-binding protein [Chloroflexi bacterium]|nr:extracellular solute-binding protein [Chloroflexota bacterium]
MLHKGIRNGTLIGLACAMVVLFSCASVQTAPSPSTTAPEAGAPSSGQQGWQQDWERTLAAARQEGTVSIYSPGGGDLRQIMVKGISDKFGLDVEWSSMKAAEVGTKISRERQAGLYLADIVQGAVSVQINELRPAGVLDPTRPMLVLPEVVDEKLWFGGQIPWVDNAKSYIVNPILAPDLKLNINTDMVRPDEIKSYNDLLAPRFKEKIVISNPLLNPSAFAQLLEIMGPDFLKKFAEQRPVIVADEGLSAQWLAHGKYPVALINRVDATQPFINAGAPIAKAVPREGVYLAGGAMALALVNRAPHPNAAKVFMNWYMSKEATTIFSRFLTMQSARLDVPTDFLSAEQMRDPSVKYLNAEIEDFRGPKILAGKKLAEEIFGSQLK